MIDTGKPEWTAALVDHKTAHHGKTRRLFFGPKAQAILMKYTDTPDGERIFPRRRDSFGHVIHAACLRAGVEPFVPYAMRHTAATRIRDEIGIEAAPATLGLSQPSMTARYSSKMDKLASDAAAACG